MVERQHDPIDAHVQDLKHHANPTIEQESIRFTSVRREDNSQAWRIETKIDGKRGAVIFPPQRLNNYLNLSREELIDHLRSRITKPDEPKTPEDKIHFNNFTDLEDWLNQHPEEPPFKAVLHFKDAHELQDWAEEHPEYVENPKFGFHLENPPIARIRIKQPTAEEVQREKELFKKEFGADRDELEWYIVEGDLGNSITALPK